MFCMLLAIEEYEAATKRKYTHKLVNYFWVIDKLPSRRILNIYFNFLVAFCCFG